MMHDPLTMIWRLGPFILWHKDPERRGSDDSCGWSYVRLNDEQLAHIRNLAWHEAYDPVFFNYRAKEWDLGNAELETLYRGLVFYVCRGLRLSPTFEEVAKMASEDLFNPVDNCHDALCFLPGWHTNMTQDTRETRQDHAASIMYGIARRLLTRRRKWWRHPRWHFWHWRLSCWWLARLRRRKNK